MHLGSIQHCKPAAIRKEEDAMLNKLGIAIPDEHADYKDQGLDAKK